jgi:hypothetical protein
MKINYNDLKIFYAIGACFAIPISTIIVLDSRPIKKYDLNSSPKKLAIQSIGYTTIGLLFGVTYPISFPIAAILVVMDDDKDNKKNNLKNT